MERDQMITDDLTNQWNKGILTTPKYIRALQDHSMALESKIAIARDFIQSVRNDTPESVEWNELNKTMEAIK